MNTRRFLAFLSITAFLAVTPLAVGAEKKAAGAERETLAKPMSEKERRKQQERLRKELEGPYRKWLNEDVAYIITDEERAAFKRLSTDDEIEQFIEQFWLRRDPTPDSIENEYKEEHYRRIAYANERFASGIPGWKSDRGRIYITFGPPDENESHPSGGSYERPMEEGGGTTSTYPFEKWRYRWIEGIGTDVIIEFVDPTMTGEYRMTMDPSEKDALLMVPGAGLTLMEQMGLASKADRFSRTDGTRLGVGDTPLPSRMNQFERLEQYAKLQKPPSIKFKDLEAAVSSTIRYNTLPMDARLDFLRMTNSTVQTNITLQFDKKDLQFQQKDGVAKAIVNIYARITSMTRRPINVFEDVVTVEVPSELLQQASKGSSVYQKSIFLPPGTFRLNVVAKDVVGGNMTNYETAIHVPRYEDEKLGASTLILADTIEKVPTRSIGTGQFVIGTSKVRPRLSETFRRDEKMGIYLQLYNFQPDEQTQKPNATVEYEVIQEGTNKKVFGYSEEVKSMEGASATQVTIEKLLPLQTMEPGKYTIKLKVTDKNTNQVLTPEATFTVT
ncbi:MAG: GWxTD domain-containing protein [Bryobacteraceae bacterium]|nr:GWxTD domain-containing protein [Bryobacterales bacterium]MEB2361527.1 GWxTD domain-containing protein [Bryobacterales bacterium]NUN00202.1 GWxTD domain-containing protein [Bryobacteraceae bacterium]